MLHRKRKIPQVNSSSSADIAFLLLVFFLITSSFDSKTGVYRNLNPAVSEEALKKRMDIQERNLLTFTIDADNHLFYHKEEILLKEIRELSKTFISNPNDVDFLPEKEPVEIPEAGTLPVTSKHIISLEVDRKSSYQTYLSVLSELMAAYNELRSEAANTLFNSSFDRLTPEQKEALQVLYPQRISEIEIKSTEGGGP
ncbi:MAG: biopolymer transporter ExbD [Candidatus Symbiothrix sp.]|jgi:biopolymer transport protein ExbD|nr:biopolymer transporter ExbD [Candidatus Symbiothrix sp.]